MDPASLPKRSILKIIKIIQNMTYRMLFWHEEMDLSTLCS